MGKEEENHNGWANYETWAVALWLTNDESSDSYWRIIVQECQQNAKRNPQVKSGSWTIEEAARFNLADLIKDQTTNDAPFRETSLYCDLLGSALQKVDWQEIAKNWLGEPGN